MIGMGVAALLGAGITVLLFIWLTGNLCRMLVAARLKVTRPLFKRDSESVEAPRPAVQTIKAVFPLGTALVLTCVFQRISLYLLESLASLREYNIYATAFKFVSTSGAVATAIFVSSFAPLTRAIDARDSQQIRHVIRRMMLLVSAVYVPACLAGILLIVPIAGAFNVDSVAEVATVMVLLMPPLYVSCVNMGLKYTLNAWALNWQDVSAVVCGITTLVIVTVFYGDIGWWTAGALGWFVGEVMLLACRLSLLVHRRKHAGVPLGMIVGCTLLLFAAAVARFPGSRSSAPASSIAIPDNTHEHDYHTN